MCIAGFFGIARSAGLNRQTLPGTSFQPALLKIRVNSLRSVRFR